MGNKVINTTSVKLQIYETSSDSQLAGMIGDVKEMEDGRKFRLCSNSTAAALEPALIVQAQEDVAFTVGAALGTASVGATTVTMTVTEGNITVNQLKDGYFVVDTGSGELGHARKIKANTAATDGTDTTLTFYDALTDVITGSSTGAYVHPIYKSVFKSTSTAKPIGVPVCDVPQSTSTTTYYFWAQVAGPCPIKCLTGAATRGDHLELVSGGGVQDVAGNTAHIGVAMQSFSANAIGWVNLNLE